MRSTWLASAVAAAVIIVPVATATGSSVPGAAPPTGRTLVADAAMPRTCHASLRPGARGVDVARWKAPAPGFLDVRSAGGDRNDWDLVLFDAGNQRALVSSESFGSHEVAQAWVTAGQHVAIQGCRRSGPAARLPVQLQFILAQRPSDAAETPSLVSVQTSDAQDVARLNALGVDVTHDVQGGHAVVHLTGADQEQLLTDKGF